MAKTYSSCRFVIGVLLPVLDVGRRDRRHEHLFDLHAIERRFEIVDVALELGVALVGDRPGADHVGMGRSGVGLRVEFRKRQSLARCGPLVARPGARVDLVTAEPLVDVADEARLAVFAVVDHVDAEIALLVDDFADGAVRSRSALPPWSNALAPPACTTRADRPAAAGCRHAWSEFGRCCVSLIGACHDSIQRHVRGR